MSPDVEQTSSIACPNCGHCNPDGWIVCGRCHAPLSAQAEEEPALLSLTDEPSVPDRPRRHHRPTHSLALASLALGVVGIFAPAGILAIIFGHVAQIQIHRNRDRYRGRDVAKLGLILGYSGVLVFAALLFGFKYAPRLTRPAASAQLARRPSASDEMSDPYYRAIRNRPALSAADRENKGVTLLKALQQAQVKYRAAHPASGYTCSLEDLFESGFDQGMLQLSIDTGYTLSITACAPNPKGLNETFRAFATPPQGGGSLLCTDDKGVIRASNAESEDACFDTGKPIAIQ